MYGTVFVYYPRGLRTGGPEALHQLVDSLRRQGQSAFLVPIPGTTRRPRVDDYAGYDAPEADAVVDAPQNAVVLPETTVPRLPAIHVATVFRWWLSVNNATSEFMSVRRQEIRSGLKGYTPLPVVLPAVAAALRMSSEWERRRLPRTMLHLTQSQYAWSHVYGTTRVPPTMLTDYISSAPTSRSPGPRADDRIAYNPRKSRRLALAVAALMPDLEFVPIQGMTREVVEATLAECVAYLDLGSHPGRDRLPREAARAGAVVVVATRGAAGYFADVPIPVHHKALSGRDLVTNAVATLRGVVDDPVTAVADQAVFRSVIAREKGLFDSQVRAVFVDGVTGSDAAGDLDRFIRGR